MRNYFYYKDKKQVVPVLYQEKNKQAKKKLDQILKTKKESIEARKNERENTSLLFPV